MPPSFLSIPLRERMQRTGYCSIQYCSTLV